MTTPEPRRRILIVDDEPLITEVLSEHFKSDFDVETALSGTDALTAIVRQRPDLVLLDINMPRMNGLELLRRIKAESGLAKIPVVIVTTEGKEEDTVAGLRAGAAAYVRKPFQHGEILGIIARL